MKPDRLQEKPCACTSHALVGQHAPFFGRRAILAASAAAFVVHRLIGQASAETAMKEKKPIVQPRTTDNMAFIQRAFELRKRAIDLGDQPYGAVIVRDKVIIGQSWSRVVLEKDPTAHAEMAAIRNAARHTVNGTLDGAVMYSTSRPCPMCEAAAYWAGIDEMIHGRAMRKTGRPVLCG